MYLYNINVFVLDAFRMWYCLLVVDQGRTKFPCWDGSPWLVVPVEYLFREMCYALLLEVNKSVKHFTRSLIDDI